MAMPRACVPVNGSVLLLPWVEPPAAFVVVVSASQLTLVVVVVGLVVVVDEVDDVEDEVEVVDVLVVDVDVVVAETACWPAGQIVVLVVDDEVLDDELLDDEEDDEELLDEEEDEDEVWALAGTARPATDRTRNRAPARARRTARPPTGGWRGLMAPQHDRAARAQGERQGNVRPMVPGPAGFSRALRDFPFSSGPQVVLRIRPVTLTAARVTLPRTLHPAAKRVSDLALASVGIVLGLPLIVLIAIAVKATTRGPVLFRQWRIGLNGRPFLMLKFRTMYEGSENLLPVLHGHADPRLFKLREDPRITFVGKAIRRFSLDEIPQLWNVLRGEMSVVGPRPALPAEAAMWDPQIARRIEVRPGITGLWQVSGRSDVDFDTYARLDLDYVENQSLALDLTILLKTLPAMVHGRGAY